MKTLVTGALGQLGSEINSLVDDYPKIEFQFLSSKQLNIVNYNLLKEYILSNNIEAVINCAAYTAVDKAEEDKELASDVNYIGTRNLVQIMEEVNGKLIHISTDYVFDGNNSIPYTEKDPINPLGIYGETKFKGENCLFNSNVNGIVIRTSWLYSSFGNNFVKTMLRLGMQNSKLNVIFDQVGSPTYARDLAKICLNILNERDVLNEDGNLYHFSNEGVASWFDFAKAIMEINNIDCEIFPIESKDFPTLASRPHYSILNKRKIKKDFKVEIPYWRDSLKDCLELIKNKK